jgi:hypothetical protein
MRPPRIFWVGAWVPFVIAGLCAAEYAGFHSYVAAGAAVTCFGIGLVLLAHLVVADLRGEWDR